MFARASPRVDVNVIVAGPANAGKTCLLERFVTGAYRTCAPTIGLDCLHKGILVDGAEVQLHLYDTAGQERYADMAGMYYRKGHACLLCFDLGNAPSFDSAVWWMKRVLDHNSECLFFLVGTKADLLTDGGGMEVGPISRWAEEHQIPFFATSALRGGAHIASLFFAIAAACAGKAAGGGSPRSSGRGRSWRLTGSFIGGDESARASRFCYLA